MKDIRHTDNGDIYIADGDLQYVTDSTAQHQKDLLLSIEGEYKLAPASTVGLPNFINADSDDDMLARVRSRFAKDGMKVTRLSTSGQKIVVDAAYSNS